MLTHRHWQPPIFHARLMILLLMLGAVSSRGQSCPPPPTQYPLGELEGPVVSNVTAGTRNGSVAVDGQAQFLVAYETNPDVQGRNTVRGSAFATITPLPWQCLWTARLSACEVAGCRHLSPSTAVHGHAELREFSVAPETWLGPEGVELESSGSPERVCCCTLLAGLTATRIAGRVQ